MSVSDALQGLIEASLIADPGVAVHVGNRVYEIAPPVERRTFPDITFGPTQELEDDADCIDGEEHFFQLDIWTRNHGRLGQAKSINDAVKAALHRADLVLPDPYALVLIEVTQKRVMQDPDGITAHGILTVRALVEV